MRARPGRVLRARRRLAAALAAALALAGCGGDEEERERGAGGGGETAARTTDTEPSRHATGTTERETARTVTEGEGPEDQPGGAGDEVPARTQALFTGRRGEIGPNRVRVPPFISVRVELRSADGAPYALRIGERELEVEARDRSDSASLGGLRPGRAYEGRGSDGGGIAIEASAEPGP